MPTQNRRSSPAKRRRGPGGRPSLQESERRCRQVNIAVTNAEKIDLARDAKIAGCPSVADYVRRRAIGVPIAASAAPARPELAKLTHELNAIGVNLNQIARNVNTERMGGPGARLDDLPYLQRKLSAALDRLLKEMDL